MKYIEYIALYTVSIVSNLRPLLFFNCGKTKGGACNVVWEKDRRNQARIKNTRLYNVQYVKY